MSRPVDSPMPLPSTSTFSFTAPFPSPNPPSTVKQRRVSLALPSSDSARQAPAWNFRDDTGLDLHSSADASSSSLRGSKMRKVVLNDEDAGDDSLALPEKKQRKKWTTDETQNLVLGCNKWGVGNWKAILKDPDLKFDSRSPVDLKDRFRTYFPDAYKQHYPNAKTHLSSRIRASLPDGKSLFEKTRSKRRRPFTEEEDRALKAGYEKHGTVWAAIVKDPVFQEQNRRSTDLRDRFRNAFPDLYEAAGYKPRPVTKKKRSEAFTPVRAATDDQLPPNSLVGPSRRKRAHTTEGLFRRGTKSVPQSTTNSDDEESSGDEDDSASVVAIKSLSPRTEHLQEVQMTTEIEMDNCTAVKDSLLIPDFVPNSSDVNDSSQSHMWCSTPDISQPWSSTNPGSPTSSQLSSSDFFGNNSPHYHHHRRSASSHHMIGNSAWGTQDWFSANPRLEPSTSFGSDSYYESLSPTLSSPFSLHTINHGVVDRYDLFPTSVPHDFSSEVGLGDSHSTFSDPEMLPLSSFRGFTHHSNYAGDLIFGSRTHQPPQSFDYGPGFGFGGSGLGLSGMNPAPNVHSMQLAASGLPGIDEIELNAISLKDSVDTDNMEDDLRPERESSSSSHPLSSDVSQYDFALHTLEDLVGLSQHSTPPGTPIIGPRSARPAFGANHVSSSHNRSLSVPPTEHRAVPQRQPVEQNQNHSKFPSTPTRSTSLFNDLPTHSEFHQLPQPHHVHHSPLPQTQIQSSPSAPPQSSNPSSSSLADALKHESYDLAFLDLHNYNGIAGHGMAMPYNFNAFTPEYAMERQGQALDLAANSSVIQTASGMFSPHSSTSTMNMNKPVGISPLLTQHVPAHHVQSPRMGVFPSLLQNDRRIHPPIVPSNPPPPPPLPPQHHHHGSSLHHRGTSAVSPSDLMLKQQQCSGSENKRKRASWDGGVF